MSERVNFPIVCVGGTNNGLASLVKLLCLLPNDMGVAIVVATQVGADAAQLCETLSPCTGMPVCLITHGLNIEPDSVFIVPEDHDSHLRSGIFHLTPNVKPRGSLGAIAACFCLLTCHWDGQMVAIIVSEYDGDGAAAFRRLRDAGGITILLKPDTPLRSKMPDVMIAPSCIDFILAPESIAQKLISIARWRNGCEMPDTGHDPTLRTNAERIARETPIRR